MMTSSILIIDDDTELCSLLAEFLALDDFVVSSVHDGTVAVKHCSENAYDAIVLDVMLPGMQGLDVLRKIREVSQIPILMLTARGEDTDRILGLELGADDYLPKPCNPRELSARLRAILRRSNMETKAETSGDTEICVGATRLNSGNRSASYASTDLQLTSAEFNILQILLQHAGNIVGKEALSKQALGRALSAYDRSIDVHISKVRKKLAAAGGDNLILSVRGAGYQFTHNSAETAR